MIHKTIHFPGRGAQLPRKPWYYCCLISCTYIQVHHFSLGCAHVCPHGIWIKLEITQLSKPRDSASLACYVYICIHIHVCIHIYTYICIIYIWSYPWTETRFGIGQAYTCMYTYKYMYVYTYECWSSLHIHKSVDPLWLMLVGVVWQFLSFRSKLWEIMISTGEPLWGIIAAQLPIGTGSVYAFG